MSMEILNNFLGNVLLCTAKIGAICMVLVMVILFVSIIRIHYKGLNLEPMNNEEKEKEIGE